MSATGATVTIMRLLVMATVAACLRPQHHNSDADLQVELVAIGDVVHRFGPALLTLDREYAAAGHAPPPGTGLQRPAERHHALLNSLSQHESVPRGDSLRVRASAPQIRGETAIIHVTVDGRLAGGRAGAFYETVAFVLERTGDRWVVRRRTQLGIS